VIELYQPHPFKIAYDQEHYNFRKIIEKILGKEDLEHVNQSENYSVFDRAHDQSTIWHKLYYENFEEFNETYTRFIREYVKPLLGFDKLVYQKIPTFRVHLVGNLAVGEWHKDKTYNHGESEVNFWMPFTDAYGNNSIWTESEEDKGDFKPYDVKSGEILVFNGANLNHGNKLNDTGHTRISVDYRIVDFDRFKPSDKGSINNNTRFDIGGYFDVC